MAFNGGQRGGTSSNPPAPRNFSGQGGITGAFQKVGEKIPGTTAWNDAHGKYDTPEHDLGPVGRTEQDNQGVSRNRSPQDDGYGGQLTANPPAAGTAQGHRSQMAGRGDGHTALTGNQGPPIVGGPSASRCPVEAATMQHGFGVQDIGTAAKSKDTPGEGLASVEQHDVPVQKTEPVIVHGATPVEGAKLEGTTRSATVSQPGPQAFAAREGDVPVSATERVSRSGPNETGVGGRSTAFGAGDEAGGYSPGPGDKSLNNKTRDTGIKADEKTPAQQMLGLFSRHG
eukprot:jgi/Botrbrau1/13080/Bobra.0187s0041.2